MKNYANQERSNPLGDQSGSFAIGSLMADSYKIIDFIGEGGMGLVYQVEHILMHKILALKILKTEHLSASQWQRFRNEAQAIARLNHQNIVRIYDMNQTSDGRPFYTMDLLSGQSLADYLNGQGTISVADALIVFRQVCDGLAYAHERGVIHRDIKPGNIMLLDTSSDGIKKFEVKIVDFGIAKLVDDGGQTIQGITRPGEIFGSPLYMSPEQCSGSKLDPRSDIYSLGVTIFHSLTGRPPFLGRSAVETTMLHHTATAPSLRAKAPDGDFPPQLENIVARMLEKSPDKRFSSLSKVSSALLALERQLEQEHSGAPQGVADRAQHQLFDFENTNEPTSNTRSFQWLNKRIILLAAGALIITAAAVMIILLPGERKVLQAPLANSLSQILETPAAAPVKTEAVLVNDYLQSGVNFFARAPRKAATNGLRMEFPSDFSMGKLYYLSEQTKEPKGWAEAQGSIDIPPNSLLKLDASDIVKDHPQLLTGFRPDELYALKFEGLEKRNAELSKYLPRFKSLGSLEMAVSGLDVSDLENIEKLKNLHVFTLGSTTFSADRLAASPLLPNLKNLDIADMIDPTPVIEQLRRLNKVMDLNLNRTKLTKADIANLCQMKQLRSLWLKSTNISDEDVESLSGLPLLGYLNIDNCKNLTVKSLASLRKFKKLTSLALPVVLISKELC